MNLHDYGRSNASGTTVGSPGSRAARGWGVKVSEGSARSDSRPRGFRGRRVEFCRLDGCFDLRTRLRRYMCAGRQWFRLISRWRGRRWRSRADSTAFDRDGRNYK